MTIPGELHWFKSSYSGGSASDCVEAAQAPGEEGLFVRDSKEPERALAFPTDAFGAFLSYVKADPA